MISYVLDTNFFINRQRPIELGKNIEEVVENFVKLAKELVKEQKIELLSTPSSVAELKSFFEFPEKTLAELLQIITVQSPDLSELKISAVLFWQLIEEVGKRLYRGLRINEELLNKALEEKGTVNSRELKQQYIAELRNKYRRATREGFIDSTVDFELIILTKQKNATLVSSDQGLLFWLKKFGGKEVLPEQFASLLKEFSCSKK